MVPSAVRGVGTSPAADNEDDPALELAPGVSTGSADLPPLALDAWDGVMEVNV